MATAAHELAVSAPSSDVIVQLALIFVLVFVAWGCCCCCTGAVSTAVCRRRAALASAQVLELPSGARVSVWNRPQQRQRLSPM